MTYTKVAKPTDATYSRVTFVGKETYDTPSLTYDSGTAFYDSIDQSVYTKIAKPTSSVYTKIAKPT